MNRYVLVRAKRSAPETLRLVCVSHTVKPLRVPITQNWMALEVGVPQHLAAPTHSPVDRKPLSGQRGDTDGLLQAAVSGTGALSPYLFNLYAEHT